MELTNWRLKKSLLSAPILNLNFYLAMACQLFFIALSVLDWEQAIPAKSLFAASFHDVFFDHQYYRLLTACFAHASWDHVLGNSIFFVPFAALLSNYFGILVFPIVSLLVGALINLIVISLYPPDSSVLGISGVIYFMVAFWLVLYVSIERGMTFRQKFIRSMGLALVEFMPEKFDVNTSYLSHAVGFALGLLFGAIFFYLNKERIRSFEVWELIEPEEPFIQSTEDDLLERLNEASIQH